MEKEVREQEIKKDEDKYRITFTKSAKKGVLDLFGKTVDSEGMVVEKDDPSQRVLSFEGKEISLEEFGGVQRGSEVFISNNFVSLLRLSKRL